MARLLRPTNRKKYPERLVMVGEPVTWDGTLYVVTGYDSDQNSVWLGRDDTVVRVSPAEINMHWEVPSH
ncbi:MAG: hypothetical protein E6Q97_05475 [Desulfurellales bacterium]|nr:MAG: hypothetical protein E6Q97_05475 [Desulfurellales bacterium]